MLEVAKRNRGLGVRLGITYKSYGQRLIDAGCAGGLFPIHFPFAFSPSSISRRTASEAFT